MSYISVNHLKYRYPLSEKLALDDISFDIEQGEFIGIIGPNGAGKSTLCQALVGLVPNFYKGAYGGSVTVGDINVPETEISDVATHVGIVFQNPFTQITGSKLTVYEEVAFGLENLGIPVDEMKQRIDHVLKLLKIYEFKDMNPFDLSGGQMQRLAIAGIIAMQPEVIVLDEPTSQLDPEGSEEVFEAVSSLSEQGMTIIMVEHKMEKIPAFADRVMVLNNGRLVDFDTPRKIFSRKDIYDYGVTPPVYTEVCKQLGITDEEGLYPVTIDDAYERMAKILERNRG
jgi:energy-coupling factor transport system ATP-binding protein